ncbi:hypothetical protein [Ornithinimicrobium kibberense]|uniref:hypothetical protein n=1 Tax=Ornithinimicrobium kibberense TaxID=282060 RepID=UPI003608DC82
MGSNPTATALVRGADPGPPSRSARGSSASPIEFASAGGAPRSTLFGAAPRSTCIGRPTICAA